jgi:hypothetical protein
MATAEARRIGCSELRGMRSQEKHAPANCVSRLGNSDILIQSNRPIAQSR